MYQYHCLCIIHFQPSFLDNKWKDLSRIYCSLLARWLHLLFPTCFSLCLIRFGLVTEQKLVNLNVSESFTLYMACFYCTEVCGCTWEGSFRSAHFWSAKKQTVLQLFHLPWWWIASECRLVYVCGTTCVAWLLLLYSVTSPARLFYNVLLLQSIQHEYKSQHATVTCSAAKDNLIS